MVDPTFTQAEDPLSGVPKKTITFAVIVIVLCVAVAGVLAMIFQTQKAYQSILVNQTQAHLEVTAKSIARSLENFITMQKNVLRSLATDPILLTLDPEADYAQLEMRYKELKGEIGGFYIISTEGIVTHRYPNKDRVGKDFSKKPGVSEVLKTRDSYVSELFFSDSGKACITVLEPIFADGEFYGVLRVLSYIKDIQSHFIEPIKIGENGYSWAIDSNTNILMHPVKAHIGKSLDQISTGSQDQTAIDQFKATVSRMIAGEVGADIYQPILQQEEGKTIRNEITAFHPVNLHNQHWSVAVSMDYSEILSPIQRQVQKTFLLAAFLVTLFGFTGFYIYAKQREEAALRAEAEHHKKLSEAADALRVSEERLARSKKMESLGLLAGGVAHDLNNVLSGIVSYPELLLLSLPQDSEMRKPVETIKVSGQRASAIVQDLLTMARGVAVTKEPLSINETIKGYLESPEFDKLVQFHPTVLVTKDLDSDLLNINGSKIHIQKVIMNLVSNASEAIVDSGRVIVSTANRYVDRPIKKYEDIVEGEYAVLSVADDGPGIAPDDLERMFEPFYTKKVMGRSGTGLGLAVVWNIVQDHKGYIDVKSNGSGTRFELYFPTTRDEIADDQVTIPLKEYMGSGERILIVDDVETQLEISQEMLETLGYNVATVPGGEEALSYLKKRSVDLVILDMIMEPGMSGKDTYEQIVTLHPDQKSIIVSGFAETEDVVAAQDLGAGKYVKKPFTIKQIGQAIKEELHR